MSAQPNSDDQDGPELQMLYGISASDITGFKQHQWSVANHAVLIQAALYGVTRLPNDTLAGWELSALVVCVALGGLVALAILLLLQHAISVRRERMRRVRISLGRRFNQAWAVKKLPDFTHLFIAGVVMLSTIVFVWLILRR